MTAEDENRAVQRLPMDYLTRAYRELLARDQAMVELLAGAAVSLLQGKPMESRSDSRSTGRERCP